MSGEVKMPSGKIDKPVIQDNRDGTVSIHYEPREEGLHELNIKYNSEHVQGTYHFNKIRFSFISLY
jgi:filamin